ncbi:kelch-like, partial [Perkinsus olseni]
VLEQMLFPSDELNTLLLANDRQTEGGLPELPLHCGYRTLYQAVSYIYGHPLTLDVKDLWPLYCFLSTYQFKKDFLETIQRVLEESISVETCCELLNSAVQQDGGGTGGDHYPLRKARRLLLMEFNDVSKTTGYSSLHWKILKDVLGSDDLTCAEDEVFNNAMRWIEVDDARLDAHLDEVLQLIRFPLMDSKLVATLDSHPVAGKSRELPRLQLAALKYHFNPAGATELNSRLRRGAVYWRLTKSKSCSSTDNSVMQTFVLAVPADLMIDRSWRLVVEKFSADSLVVAGVLAVRGELAQEDSPEVRGAYIGRYSNGWGLACFGNLYNGGCKCSAAMQDLCTPVCQTHLPFLRCSAGTETIDMQITSKETTMLSNE